MAETTWYQTSEIDITNKNKDASNISSDLNPVGPSGSSSLTEFDDLLHELNLSITDNNRSTCVQQKDNQAQLPTFPTEEITDINSVHPRQQTNSTINRTMQSSGDGVDNNDNN